MTTKISDVSNGTAGDGLLKKVYLKKKPKKKPKAKAKKKKMPRGFNDKIFGPTNERGRER